MPTDPVTSWNAAPDGVPGPPRAVVLGGGIGGLTAALALVRHGWRVRLYERAAALDPVGAGLAVAPNALRALDVLGLGDAVRERAAVQGEAGLRRPSGRWLARTSGAELARAFGDPVAVLHRADLVAVLAAALPDGVVRTGTPADVRDPGSADRPATVTADGHDLTADLVVAADGLRSRTRDRLFPGHPGPRYSGFTTWRTVITGGPRPVPFGETWGPGALAGLAPLVDGRVYLYASVTAPAGERAPDGDERAELLRRFGHWCAPLPQLLAAAEPDAVLRHDVYELAEPLPAFHHARVALLGDAAHAMTPFQGQGACQAVEDAVVLAHLVRPGEDPYRALPAYTAARLPRTTGVVARSRRVGRAVAVTAPPAVLLRDAALALAGRLPRAAVVRATAPTFGWRPPAAPAP